jgi:hypothetical protein
MKNPIKLLDLIKQCRTMNTIRVQELNSTEDFETLKTLYSAYVDTAMENLVQETPSEQDYVDFYYEVLQRFYNTL